MYLPWNKKYIEIAIHVIYTVSILVLIGAFLFHVHDVKIVFIQITKQTLSILSPIIWSIAITILLEPLVCFFDAKYQKKYTTARKNRHMGTIFAYLTFFTALFLIVGLLVRFVGAADFSQLLVQIENFIQILGDWLIILQLKLSEHGLLQNVEGFLSESITAISIRIQQTFMHIASALPSFGGQFLNALIGFAAAFYFLSEKEQIQTFLKHTSILFLGEQKTKKLCHGFTTMYRIWIGYLSGQLLDGFVMGALFCITFSVIGIPYGILIGLLSGFSNLIPYFGALVAFFLAVLSGLFSDEPIRALYAAIAILILQQIDSTCIVPRLVGKRVELHPVLVLFSLAIFGGLFGFWGLLFAVPLGAICKELFFWLYRKKSHTPI